MSEDARSSLATLRRLVFDPHVPIAQQRRRLAVASALTRSTPVTRRADEIAGVVVERFVPPGALAGRAVLYVHGGGYCVGSPATAAGLVEALSGEWSAEVVAVQYRLAPEHPAPAARDDVARVLDAGEWSVAVGDSAGAGALAAAIQAGARPPAALALLSPWLDLSRDWSREPGAEDDPVLQAGWLEQCAAAYAGGDRRDPGVSPLFGEWSAMPPTIVVTGGRDLLAPDARALRGIAPAIEVLEVPSAWHGVALWAGRDALADAVVARVAATVAATLGWR